MKRLFIFLIVFISCILISCEEPNYQNVRTINIDNKEYIVIGDDDFGYKYQKIKVENHDFYFRRWKTRNGEGSDLVHNPNCWCNKKDSI